MKILIIHEVFPPDVTGGGETLTLKIAKGLKERGYSVKVLTTGDPRIKKYEGIETIRLPINRYLMNFAAPIIAWYARDADIIHTSSGNACFPSWIAAKILNKPICCYVHHIFGSYWKDIRDYIGFLFQFIEKIFLTRDYNAIIFQNETSKRIGLKTGIEKKRIFVLQPGIDYQKFRMKNVKKEPFVLFVGNISMNKSMVKIKGLEYLIEAAKYFPKTKFYIIGEGSYLDELKKKSPVNIIFMGAMFGKKLIRMYNKALIFCLPSLTEGFGLSILEAMTSGCAIVSTVDIGQEGIIIKPKNVNEIVKGIKYYIDNPKKAKDVGIKNRKLAKKFTWKQFIDKLTKIYDSIIIKS